jgi:antagonist of KipI
MQILINKPGILSTIQDLGRTGYQNSGIPVAGAMDPIAAQIANILVGNRRNAPVIELTYGNVEMTTETELLICCCGGGATLFAGEKELPSWKPLFVPAGIKLVFKNQDTGSRTYIAAAGGWQSSVMLGSGSTYLPAKMGGFGGRALQKHDRVETEKRISPVSQALLVQLGGDKINSPSWGAFISNIVDYSTRVIRILKEQEFEWFSKESQQDIFYEPYELSRQCDRMGIQLTGKPLTIQNKKQLLSTSVNKGTIQVTPAGTMILLMADCQTTGGYPRIARVAAIDLPVCAQLKPGDKISFEEIGLHEAEDLYLQQQEKLLELEQAVIEKPG